MIPEERRRRIVEKLKEDQSATVIQLCDLLKASEATIRRDLTLLEEDGKLERVHGGAIINANRPLDIEHTFNEKEGEHLREKQMIAETAFRLLRDNDSVFLDGGTTNQELAKLIGRSRIKVHVFTNSPLFSQYIARNPKAELFIIGGKVRSNTLAVVGQLAIDSISHYRLDKVFIGVNGISPDYGLTTPDYQEADIKRAVLERGRERIIMADSSKFSRVALCEIMPISGVDKIITSRIDDPSLREAIEEAGVAVVEVMTEEEVDV